MTGDTSRTTLHADFAGRRRKFCLRIGEIGELERLCGAGIGEILQRQGRATFRAADIREPIFLGLQGGGASEPEATALVQRYVDGGPIGEHLELAAAIVMAAIAGVKVDPGNADGPRPESPETSAPSTPPEQPPASALGTST